MRDRAVRFGLADAAAFRTAMGTETIHQELKTRTLRPLQASGVAFIDAACQLVKIELRDANG